MSSSRKTSSSTWFTTLAEALDQLKTMGILDSTITLSQMLKWTQPLAGIKDHSNMPVKMTNAYDANYKIFRGANYARAKQLKREIGSRVEGSIVRESCRVSH